MKTQCNRNVVPGALLQSTLPTALATAPYPQLKNCTSPWS